MEEHCLLVNKMHLTYEGSGCGRELWNSQDHPGVVAEVAAVYISTTHNTHLAHLCAYISLNKIPHLERGRPPVIL